MSALRVVLILAAASTLPACATTDGRTAARTAPQRAGVVVDTDHEYVARVESIARRRGIDVQWIHMPTKRTVRGD